MLGIPEEGLVLGEERSQAVVTVKEYFLIL